MNSQKLTIREIILLVCLCAEYYRDTDAYSPFKDGFELPVYRNPLTDADRKLACVVYVTGLGDDAYDSSLVISDALPKHSHADIISCSSYLDHVNGKSHDGRFDNLRLSCLENAGLLHPDLIDKTFFFIDYNEVPFALSVQELDKDGECVRSVDEFDLPDFAKAKERADKENAAVVFVDKSICNDEYDSNPIIYPSGLF